jgi:hypothetical protein
MNKEGCGYMFNLSLTACSFWIKKLNSQKLSKIYNLNDTIEVDKDGEKHEFSNVRELFKSFFHNHVVAVNDDDNKKTFSCEFKSEYQGETKDYHFMYTVINSGTYGSASEITDIETRQINYKRKPNEADERPFHLFIVIPKDSEDVTVQKGMFLFQNLGGFGVKTITTQYMSAYFSKEYNITLKCSTIAPDLFVKKVIKRENIKKLIMVKNHTSNDTTDNIRVGYGVETRQIANLTFNDTMWEKIMSKIRYCAKGKSNLFEFESKEYDSLKVNVKIGERERTIDLHNLENLSIIEGIPDEIKMADGHPNKEKLIKHFEKVADEYLIEMVLQIK